MILNKFSFLLLGIRDAWDRDLEVLTKVSLLKCRFLRKDCNFGNIHLGRRSWLQTEKQRDVFTCLRTSCCLDS